MKKTLSIIAVALLLFVALTACSQDIVPENNEILVQYMSRILSTANSASSATTTSTVLTKNFGFTTGTALLTTETSATTVEFKNAKTTESNAVEAKITFNEDEEHSKDFAVEFTCDGVVYKAEGTATPYELKSYNPTYWAEFTSLKIGKKTYNGFATLVTIVDDN